MTPPRVLVPDRALRSGGAVQPPPDALHHLRFVLRLKAGADVTVIDGDGDAWDAVLVGGEDGMVLKLLTPSRKARAVRESAEWVLVLALLKGDHTEWAVQKATEAGVFAVVLAVCERSIARPALRDLVRRAERFRKVAAEAARQAGRATAPRVDLFASLDEALQAVGDAGGSGTVGAMPRFVLDEAPGTPALARCLAERTGCGGAVLAIGPEGSFSDRERARMEASGFLPAGLGPRVLRAETAAVAAVIVAQAVAGDMR